jgi:hypothetical protein
MGGLLALLSGNAVGIAFGGRYGLALWYQSVQGIAIGHFYNTVSLTEASNVTQ